MTIQREARVNTAEVLDRVLDKGIVIDAWMRVSLVGIDLITVDAHVVVASIETYNRYDNELNRVAAVSPPAVKGRTSKSRGAGEPASLQIVREAFDAWNGHDGERYSALLADTYIGETYRTPAPLHGRDAARQAMDAYFKVLPDLHFTIESTVAAADDVLVSWLATGTPRDEYSGSPLTERRLEVPGCTVTRLHNGKIVHTWDYWDTTTTGES